MKTVALEVLRHRIVLEKIQRRNDEVVHSYLDVLDLAYREITEVEAVSYDEYNRRGYGAKYECEYPDVKIAESYIL